MQYDEHSNAMRALAPRILALLATLLALVLGLWLGWMHLDDAMSLRAASVTLSEDEGELPDDILDLTYDERVDLLPSIVRIPPVPADELEAIYAGLDYTWPPESSVPAVALAALPRNLGELDVDRRKSLFFRALLPLIMAENQILRETRRRALALFDNGTVDVDSADYRSLETLARRFRVEGAPNDNGFREALMRRLDTVPVDLALAQAANESGWGTSRFTQEANNLFGVWTWREDGGIVPEARAEGATHRIRVFPTLRAAVRNYVYTLNVGNAYRALRRLRQQAREAGTTLSGLELAAGLTAYSERGEEYVEEIQAMIRHNALDSLAENLSLVSVDGTGILDTIDTSM